MAKHTIDIIEGVKNFSQMKLFTINNPSEENISFSNDGLYPCIKVTKEEVQKYIEQNKFYYIHTYGEIYNLTDDIYGTILVYNKEDNCYNIGILNMSSDIGMKGDIITFINLTKRINSDNEYWTPKYCFYNYEKFHNYQTTLMYLFDTRKESAEDLLLDIIQKYKFKLSKEKANVITLNNKELYQQKFDKLFNERVDELKKEIESILNNEKQKSESEITKLTEKITYTQEDLNNVREWN